MNIKVMSALNDGIFGGGCNAIALGLLLRDQQILICSYMVTMGCLISLQYVTKMYGVEKEKGDGETPDE